MLLQNKKYYNVLSVKCNETNTEAIFQLAILPDCEVYNGHFPNDPVCPGVCNIETIKECTMILLNTNLYIKHIKQCRLTAIATPTICPEVTITIKTEAKSSNEYLVTAAICDSKQKYMEFKGTMITKLEIQQ